VDKPVNGGATTMPHAPHLESRESRSVENEPVSSRVLNNLPIAGDDRLSHDPADQPE